MRTFIILFIILVSVAYFVVRCLKKLARKSFEKKIFTVEYEAIKGKLIKKLIQRCLSEEPLYNKKDDSETLTKIVFKNLANEEKEIRKNPKKFYNKLFKEYKKSKKGSRQFIDERLIGFMCCYGLKEWNL